MNTTEILTRQETKLYTSMCIMDRNLWWTPSPLSKIQYADSVPPYQTAWTQSYTGYLSVEEGLIESQVRLCGCAGCSGHTLHMACAKGGCGVERGYQHLQN